jgi:hypothetical protein
MVDQPCGIVLQLIMIMFFWVLAPYRLVSTGDSMFLRNDGIYRRVYTAPKLRSSSSSPHEILKSYKDTETLITSTPDDGRRGSLRNAG